MRRILAFLFLYFALGGCQHAACENELNCMRVADLTELGTPRNTAPWGPMVWSLMQDTGNSLIFEWGAAGDSHTIEPDLEYEIFVSRSQSGLASNLYKTVIGRDVLATPVEPNPRCYTSKPVRPTGSLTTEIVGASYSRHLGACMSVGYRDFYPPFESIELCEASCGTNQEASRSIKIEGLLEGRDYWIGIRVSDGLLFSPMDTYGPMKPQNYPLKSNVRIHPKTAFLVNPLLTSIVSNKKYELSVTGVDKPQVGDLMTIDDPTGMSDGEDLVVKVLDVQHQSGSSVVIRVTDAPYYEYHDGDLEFIGGANLVVKDYAKIITE